MHVLTPPGEGGCRVASLSLFLSLSVMTLSCSRMGADGPGGVGSGCLCKGKRRRNPKSRVIAGQTIFSTGNVPGFLGFRELYP